jgi:hypothetical protein
MVEHETAQVDRRLAWMCQLTELPNDLPNIVGQIPLESMDWVIDITRRKLIGNPEHGGELLNEEF